jgi:hypothetical protein
MTDFVQVEYTEPALAFPVEEGLVRACRETFGTHLRAVVLTGSLARNEESYIYHEGKAILQSDVEALVVLHDDAPLPSRQASRSLCQLAGEFLAARGVSVEVSLSVVHGAYLRHLPPHIYSYELRSCGVVLFGEPTILSLIPNYSAANLSREDAWRMLSNRLIEQMSIEPSASHVRYRSIKLCLDVASSMLVFFGRFDAGYRARLHCMEEFALAPAAQQLPISLEEFMPLLRVATSAKLQSEISVDFGNSFEDRITGLAWQVWLWQLQQLSGNDSGDPESMVRAFGRGEGKKKLLRGWLYVVRRTGWLGSVRYWPRWFSLFCAGLTPRHAIYLAAHRWHQGCFDKPINDVPRTLRSVSSLLPVNGSPKAACDGIVAQLVWNYKEFTLETRS